MNYRKTVTVTIEGLGEAIKNISVYDLASTRKIEAAVKDGVKEIANLSKGRVQKRTGKLRKSIKSTYQEQTITGIAKSNVRYAHLVEFGAKAVNVKPKNKKAMAIDEFGIRRYAASVDIPERKPRPFMVPSYEEEKPVIERKIAQVLKEVKR